MSRKSSKGFTLLEVLLAVSISAIIFAAIYGVFAKAIHLRDHAAALTRDLQTRSRALAVLRQDLRCGYVSNGLLALTMKGMATSQQSHFPGYLRFTTTTSTMVSNAAVTGAGSSGTFTLGQTSGSDPTSGDVQEVEYYIAADSNAGANTGALTRVVYHDLLDNLTPAGDAQTLLSGVSAMELSFYDPGAQGWTDTWDETTSGTAGTSATAPIVFTPSAVRVRLRGVPNGTEAAPLIAEIVAPWLNEPWLPTP